MLDQLVAAAATGVAATGVAATTPTTPTVVGAAERDIVTFNQQQEHLLKQQQQQHQQQQLLFRSRSISNITQKKQKQQRKYCREQQSILMHHFISLYSVLLLSKLLILLVVSSSLLIQPCSGTLYILSKNETYSTLPGLFGKYMMDDRTYVAKLQYLPENPYLCNVEPHTSFRPSAGVTLPTTSSTPISNTFSNHNSSNSNSNSASQEGIHLPGDPILLLVARGNCPFYQKAIMAEQIDKNIQFVAVYNTAEQGEDVLVPMYSDESNSGDTRLVMLSITHAAGQALKRYIANQTIGIIESGGPRIELDSQIPPGLLLNPMDEIDFQTMLISALGLFFLMLSFVGCVIIFVSTFGQVRFNTSNGRIIVVMGNNTITTGNVGEGSNPNDGSMTVFGITTSRRLLSIEEVRQLQILSNETTNSNNTETSSNEKDSIKTSSNDDGVLGHYDVTNHDSMMIVDNNEDTTPTEHHDDCCAICLGDDIHELPTTDIITLPCQHKFHYDCIVPWLTERQSKCPLCKFDVLHHVRNNHTNDTTATNSSNDLRASHDNNTSMSSEESSSSEETADPTSSTRSNHHRSTITTRIITATWNRLRYGHRWTPIADPTYGSNSSIMNHSNNNDDDIEQQHNEHPVIELTFNQQQRNNVSAPPVSREHREML